MAKDYYRQQAKKALEKDGWLITHDPYHLDAEIIGLEIDLEPDKMIAAEKRMEKIAVVIKGFDSSSFLNDFHDAMGQFNNYYVALETIEPNRTLFLAVPETTYINYFKEIAIQSAIQRMDAKIFIYNPLEENIVKWIR